MKMSALAILTLLIAGCSSVLMKDPFPDSELTQQEKNELSGTWMLDDTVMHVAFSSNGVPLMATLDWDQDQFVPKKFRLHAAKRDNTLYLSMPDEPNGKPSSYIFAEIRPDGDRMFVWLPDPDFFAEQINKGALKGTAGDDHGTKKVVLETPASEILSLISTNPSTFDYKEPLALEKVK